MLSTIPQNSPSTTPGEASSPPELDALLHTAAMAPLPGVAWIKVTGEDRVRWLNGMVTNSVVALTPGDGAYNFLLNVQGRIQGDAYVFAEPDELLLQTSTAQLPHLLPLLDRFIIMDDVELTDISAARSGLLLAGPHALELLQQLNLHSPAGPAPSLTHVTSPAGDVLVLHAYSPLVPRFEIWAPEPTLADLTAQLQSLAIPTASPEALHQLRVLEGTPLFGTDIRDRDLPQETGATRALHFSKGCYLGQEIVERIRSRGQVHRTFGGFTLSGAPATPGTPLAVEGKPAGELTSVAVFPTSSGPLQFALGYIRREFLVGDRPIDYPGGTATPSPLPISSSTLRTAPTI